jgi:hypothetical protein
LSSNENINSRKAKNPPFINFCINCFCIWDESLATFLKKARKRIRRRLTNVCYVELGEFLGDFVNVEEPLVELRATAIIAQLVESVGGGAALAVNVGDKVASTGLL